MPRLPEHATPRAEIPEQYRVLAHGPDRDPRDTMLRYLRSLAEDAFDRHEWRSETLETTAAIEDRRAKLREWFVSAIGGLPERTPLSPRVTGTVERPEYTVETVVFESQPEFSVTGALFLPGERYEPPYPGVVVSCGHSMAGKATEAYQKATALLAANGIAGFVFDPVGLGERAQFLSPEGERVPRWATEPHQRLGAGEVLLGRNVARTMIWDGTRALDYLASRDDIDADRLGAMGNSGGGMQTAYLAALDDRVAASSPVGYVKSYRRRVREGRVTSDAEQNVHGQLARGLLDEELLLLAAPAPTLIGVASHDQYFPTAGTWEVFRAVKRIYGKLGCPERVDLAEADTTHGFYRPLREAAVHWMVRWLRDEDRPVTEPEDLPTLDEDEIRCTPEGQVLAREGDERKERSAYDLCRAYDRDLASVRNERWQSEPRESMLGRVRDVAGVRPLDEIPEPSAQTLRSRERDGYVVDDVVLDAEPGIRLPALRFVPNEPGRSPPLLWLHGDGKHAAADPGGPIEGIVSEGRTVLAVDVRGIGETAQDRFQNLDGAFGTDWAEVFLAYRLGRSYVGMRTEDVLTCARGLADDGPADAIGLHAVGTVAIPALHAAALEGHLFESVELVDAPRPWRNVVGSPEPYALANLVHGALETYDLRNLLETLEGTTAVEHDLGRRDDGP